MSSLYYTEDTPQRIYWDRRYYTNFETQIQALTGSTILYVGNLSFYTTELQIRETFSRVGPVKRIIMGLNSQTKTPCGFCFVEYFTSEHANACLKYISGTICDDRIIRCELDGGFQPGRQYGRGKLGGQIRDERKMNNTDVGRGGKAAPKEEEKSVLGKRKNENDDEDEVSHKRKNVEDCGWKMEN